MAPFTVYYDAAQSIVAQYGDQLDGKVVVDITNPVNVETFDGLVTPADSSAQPLRSLPGKRLRGPRWSRPSTPPSPAPWSKARSAVRRSTSSSPGTTKGPRKRSLSLSGPGDSNAIDAGPLKRARELEALGFLHMSLQDKLGTGYKSTVKIIS